MAQLNDTEVITQEELNSNFLKAIGTGRLVEAEELLQKGADLNSKTGKDFNALFVAINKKQIKSFEWLLSKGININDSNLVGETVLMFAAKKNKTEYVELLIKHKDGIKLDINAKDSIGNAALHYCAMFRSEASAELLIKNGADVNIKSSQNTTPILMAAQTGSLSIVKLLHKKGAFIDDVDVYGQDVLINAVFKSPHGMKPEELIENNELCQYLLDNGADVDYVSKSGLNALFSAAMFAQAELVEKILGKCKNPDMAHNYHGVNNMTPFIWAAQAGNLKICEMFIKAKADINYKNSEGNSPTSFAFMYKELRKLFLDNGADVNAIFYQGDKHEETYQEVPILTFPITGADKDIFEEMVKKQVKLSYDKEEYQKYDPLKLCISLGLTEFAEKILDELHPDLNILWNLGKPDMGKLSVEAEDIKMSPLMFLVTANKAQKLQAFLSEKRFLETMLNAKNQDGTSILPEHSLPKEKREELEKELEKFKHVEKELDENQKKMFDLLIQKGADVNFVDEKGKTALNYCNGVEYIPMLIEKGADLFHKDENGLIPLADAIIKGKTDIADEFIRQIVDGNLKDREEVKSLLLDMIYSVPEGYAATQSFTHGIQHTYNKDSPAISYKDVDGNSPLIIACATDQASIASLLTEMGANINDSNNDGETPLMWAIGKSNPVLVDHLIDKGADLHALTKDGKSIDDFSKEINNNQIRGSVLKAMGSNLNDTQLGIARKIKPNKQ